MIVWSARKAVLIVMIVLTVMPVLENSRGMLEFALIVKIIMKAVHFVMITGTV